MSVLETVLKIHFWKSRWLFGFNQKPTDIESEILNLKSSKSVDFRLKPKVHQKWNLDDSSTSMTHLKYKFLHRIDSCIEILKYPAFENKETRKISDVHLL